MGCRLSNGKLWCDMQQTVALRPSWMVPIRDGAARIASERGKQRWPIPQTLTGNLDRGLKRPTKIGPMILISYDSYVRLPDPPYFRTKPGRKSYDSYATKKGATRGSPPG